MRVRSKRLAGLRLQHEIRSRIAVDTNSGEKPTIAPFADAETIAAAGYSDLVATRRISFVRGPSFSRHHHRDVDTLQCAAGTVAYCTGDRVSHRRNGWRGGQRGTLVAARQRQQRTYE